MPNLDQTFPFIRLEIVISLIDGSQNRHNSYEIPCKVCMQERRHKYEDKLCYRD